jgi:hypothetical protein
MNYSLIPLTSLGPIKLGALRTEVHQIMGEPEASFRKTPASLHDTDSFNSRGFHLYYRDEPAVVEFIEVFAATEVNFNLFGLDPFSAPIDQLVALLETKTPGRQEEDESWIFPELSISLWQEDPSSDVVTAVGLGIKGYFE